MSPYAAGDSELALEVAGAYQEIGMLYQYGYRDRALHAFTNAALVLAGIAAGDPSEGPYRAQWIAVTDLIRALGGDVPAWVARPTPHTQVAATPNAPPRGQTPVPAPTAEAPQCLPRRRHRWQPVSQAEYDRSPAALRARHIKRGNRRGYGAPVTGRGSAGGADPASRRSRRRSTTCAPHWMKRDKTLKRQPGRCP